MQATKTRQWTYGKYQTVLPSGLNMTQTHKKFFRCLEIKYVSPKNDAVKVSVSAADRRFGSRRALHQIMHCMQAKHDVSIHETDALNVNIRVRLNTRLLYGLNVCG